MAFQIMDAELSPLEEEKSTIEEEKLTGEKLAEGLLPVEQTQAQEEKPMTILAEGLSKHFKNQG